MKTKSETDKPGKKRKNVLFVCYIIRLVNANHFDLILLFVHTHGCPHSPSYYKCYLGHIALPKNREEEVDVQGARIRLEQGYQVKSGVNILQESRDGGGWG